MIWGYHYFRTPPYLVLLFPLELPRHRLRRSEGGMDHGLRRYVLIWLWRLQLAGTASGYQNRRNQNPRHIIIFPSENRGKFCRLYDVIWYTSFSDTPMFCHKYGLATSVEVRLRCHYKILHSPELLSCFKMMLQTPWGKNLLPLMCVWKSLKMWYARKWASNSRKHDDPCIKFRVPIFRQTRISIVIIRRESYLHSLLEWVVGGLEHVYVSIYWG